MKQLLALQARDVRAFLAARRGEGVGSRSLARSLSALRMFYASSSGAGYGKNDAIRAVSLPKLPHSVPKPLTAPKATALVDSADIASPDAPEWILARDTAVLALLYGSGLRISEALSLQPQGRADQRPRHAARDGQGQQDAGGAGAADRARGGRALSRALSAASSARRSAVRRRARQAALAPHHPAQDRAARAPRSACRRRRRRMRCAIPSPRICLAPAPICARSRSCSATPACRPRRAIPRSTARICSRPTTSAHPRA